MHQSPASSFQTPHAYASAPGKMVLLGEYVVLEGAPALVMAIDRRAEAHFEAHTHAYWEIHAVNLDLRARLVPDTQHRFVCTTPETPKLHFVLQVFKACMEQTRAPVPYGTLTLDTKAFFWRHHKLGLGSSAAITCACWHALQQACQRPTSHHDLAQVWQTLHDLHHTAQGKVGSGIDIAASLYGGILRYQRAPNGVAQMHRMSTSLDVHILPIWSGRSASTAPRLQAFGHLKKENPRVYWQLCERLAVLAHAGTEFWSLQHKQAFLTIIDQYHDTLLDLGKHMDVEIITPEHAQISQLARACGAAYKSSGAGGGDLGMAVCPDMKTVEKVKKRLRAHGFQTLALPTAQSGLFG